MTYLKRSRRAEGPVVAIGAAAIALVLNGCGSSAASREVAAGNKEAVAMRDHQLLVENAREAMRRGDSIRAEHYFALALEGGHDESEILPELLAVCLSSSRLRSALNYASPYLRRHPDDSGLRYLIATLHLGLGQEATAKSELETVLRHAPEYADALFLLGMLEFDSEPERARQRLKTYLSLRPTGDKSREARERMDQAHFIGLHQKRAENASDNTVSERVTDVAHAPQAEEWP